MRLLSLLFPIVASASPHARFAGQSNSNSTVIDGSIPSRACGTGPPSDFLLNEHRGMLDQGMSKRASPQTTRYLVDVYFHVVSTRDQRMSVTPAMVANQFGVLQKAYARSNITFRLTGVDFTVNNKWAKDEDDVAMKQALRKGTYSSLNVYFQSDLTTTVSGVETMLLGYCTLPTNATYVPCFGCKPVEYPAADYAVDGCNVLAGSMPGGDVYGYDSGKTAVHEISHWFGLLHTFQDTTCDTDDPGDYIDDTPQESVSTNGCPVGKDSCVNCPGLDPIHNFMDYSTDACYESFTPGQIMRMHNMYGALRYLH